MVRKNERKREKTTNTHETERPDQSYVRGTNFFRPELYFGSQV